METHTDKIKTVTFFDFAPLNFGGGCEKNFMKFGAWLRKREYRVNFVTSSLSFAKMSSFVPLVQRYECNISDDDLKEEFGVMNHTTFGFTDIFLPTKARKALKKTLYSSDIVIAKNEILEIIALGLFSVDFKKVVLEFHTPIFYPASKSIKSRLHNWFYASRAYFFILRKAKARCLVLTQQMKDLFMTKYMAENVIVIPNPIDIGLFIEKKYKKEDHFKIYYIGRLVALSKRFPNCHFQGFQSSVVVLYHDADIVVVPSRWEGFPYVILEAQSCGTPVVTTDIPGCVDIVKNGITGWVCLTNDAVDTARSISEAYALWEDDFDRMIKMGGAARQNIVKNYEEDRINQKVIDFLGLV